MKLKLERKHLFNELFCQFTFRSVSEESSWSWSYGSWIYNYLCNQCLSPLTLWVRIPFRRGVLNTTLCDKVYKWLATGRWFSPGTPVSSPNKPDCESYSNKATLLLGWSHDYQNNTFVITIWLTVTKYPYLKWQWIFDFWHRFSFSSITAKSFTGLDCIYE